VRREPHGGGRGGVSTLGSPVAITVLAVPLGIYYMSAVCSDIAAVFLR
jgi:hypothetical protein